MIDEEVLNLLTDSTISVLPESGKEKYTLGQRAADSITKFSGSRAFIFFQRSSNPANDRECSAGGRGV